MMIAEKTCTNSVELFFTERICWLEIPYDCNKLIEVESLSGFFIFSEIFLLTFVYSFKKSETSLICG